jgi:LuxR family maltose regulon positive regulatory protein
MLTELEYVGHKGRLPRIVCSAKLERARLLLLQGHVHAAREELDRADEPALWARVDRLRYLANDVDYLALARMRWHVHAGATSGVAEQLAAAATEASSASRHRRALKLRLLQALATHRAGDIAAAVVLLGSVLKTTCAEGFERIVLDEGEAFGPLVHALLLKLNESGTARRDPVFSDYVTRLARGFAPHAAAVARTDDSSAPALLLEPLTRKEIRVLHLLAEGYSNNAMAEKLFVSDSTVRTHLRNIYTKLDTHSRTQAVAIARRLGVIG